MTNEADTPEFEHIVANPDTVLPQKPKGLSLAETAVFLQNETSAVNQPETNQ